MKIFVVIDKNDTASMNIYDKLINEEKIFLESNIKFKNNKTYFYKDSYLIMNDSKSAESEDIDKEIEYFTSIKPELIIFPTVHRSKSGIPSFSSHVPGNWNIAEAGGSDKKLCVAAESFIKESLIYMKSKDKAKDIENFDIIQEATHHGPLISVPCMFIEIGSTEKEWTNQNAGRLIASTIIHLIENKTEILNKNYKSFVGIGGPHSCSNFMKIVFNDDELALGHLCPKHSLEYINEHLIEEALEKNINSSNLVILDWKGMGQEKQRIVNILNNKNIKFMKVKDFSY